jgi:uncharacterized protein (TIGR02611 family)
VASEPAKPSFVERMREQRTRHRQRTGPVRALYVAAGFTVLLAGIVMLIAPGPAFVVIPIGLALLSLEFAWAERLLEVALQKGEQARTRASQTTRGERVLSAAAVLLALLAWVAWGYWGDIPLAPF